MWKGVTVKNAWHILRKRYLSSVCFEDENEKMNLSLNDVGGEILLVSQFTLAGNVEHGYRPSFTNAEEPKRAEELYLKLAENLNQVIPTKTGVFGADMKIEQENDGPVTIII